MHSSSEVESISGGKGNSITW